MIVTLLVFVIMIDAFLSSSSLSSSLSSHHPFQHMSTIFMTHMAHMILSTRVHHEICCVPYAVKALLNGYAKSQNSQRAALWLECMEANDVKPSGSAMLPKCMACPKLLGHSSAAICPIRVGEPVASRGTGD